LLVKMKTHILPPCQLLSTSTAGSKWATLLSAQYSALWLSPVQTRGAYVRQWR
jgi:hypothetical protein